MNGSKKYPYPPPGWSLGILSGGGGSQRPKFLKKSMKLNWNFQRGGEGERGFKVKNHPVGRHGYFQELHNIKFMLVSRRVIFGFFFPGFQLPFLVIF